MTESQVIDLQALARLKEWGGDKLAGQMVRLFLKNSGTRMDQIMSVYDQVLSINPAHEQTQWRRAA